ncbi:MAG: hypothetical protein KGZ35_01555 [Truepera sp.]|nr:hypothetical protein [Truepera sp.]
MRLAKAFGTTPEVWLGMQQDYDLWQAKQHADLSGVQVLMQHIARSEGRLIAFLC